MTYLFLTELCVFQRSISLKPGGFKLSQINAKVKMSEEAGICCPVKLFSNRCLQ